MLPMPAAARPPPELDAASTPARREPGPILRWLTKEPNKPFRRHRFVVLPQVRSEPGTGVGLGVRGSYAYRVPGYRWSKARVDLGLLISTRLVQRHTFDVMLRDLLDREEIFTLSFEFVDDPVFPYLGVANEETIPTRTLQQEFFRVSLMTTGPSLVYQHPLLILEPDRWPGLSTAYFRVFGGYRFRWDRFDPEDETLFAEEVSPDRVETRRGSWVAGLVWDSRDVEANPKWGAFHDVAVELGGPWAGGSTTWSRVSLTTRFYRQIAIPNLVIAQTLRLDAAAGDVPLMTLGEMGGLEPQEGIGGRFMGRGFLRRRFIGKRKGYASLELRAEPIAFRLRGRLLTPGFKAFVDAGTVMPEGHIRLGDLHVSGGGGIYAVWDRFLVIRLDLARSREGFATYFVIHHAF